MFLPARDYNRLIAHKPIKFLWRADMFGKKKYIYCKVKWECLFYKSENRRNQMDY